MASMVHVTGSAQSGKAGDSEMLGRLRERSENATTRPAGVSALLDADIAPGPPGQDAGQDADPE